MNKIQSLEESVCFAHAWRLVVIIYHIIYNTIMNAAYKLYFGVCCFGKKRYRSEYVILMEIPKHDL